MTVTRARGLPIDTIIGWPFFLQEAELSDYIAPDLLANESTVSYGAYYSGLRLGKRNHQEAKVPSGGF